MNYIKQLLNQALENEKITKAQQSAIISHFDNDEENLEMFEEMTENFTKEQDLDFLINNILM